jgi:hypothetical protein
VPWARFFIKREEEYQIVANTSTYAMSIDVLPTHRTVEQSGLAGFPLLVARMLDDCEEQQCWHRLSRFQGLSIGLYRVYDVRGVLEKKRILKIYSVNQMIML